MFCCFIKNVVDVSLRGRDFYGPKKAMIEGEDRIVKILATENQGKGKLVFLDNGNEVHERIFKSSRAPIKIRKFSQKSTEN